MIILPKHFRRRTSAGLAVPRRGICEFAAPLMLLAASGGGGISVLATNSGTDNSGGSASATVQLPAGITAGEKLLIVGVIGAGAISDLASAGWTVVSGMDGTVGAGPIALWKTATGSEGASASVTWTTSRGNRWTSFRIAGAHTAAPEAGSRAGPTNNSNPDPGSVTPSWGSAASLFIPVVQVGTASNGVTGYPSGYINQYSTGGSGTIGIGVCTLVKTASTEDPGTFTTTSSANWFSQTIAVRPA